MHRDIPYGTIRTTIHRERERLNNVSKPRTGRPHLLTDEERDRLYDTAISNPHIKTRELVLEVDNALKDRTIRRLLREMGLRKWRQHRRPELTDEHARKRLQWARAHEDFMVEDWARVVWSDECTIECGAGVAPVWTFLRPSEQILRKDVRSKRTGKGVSQMFWGAFGQRIHADLIDLHGDPEARRGGVTARVIYNLYLQMLPEILNEDSIFMQDNAPVHTARVVKSLLADLHINVMPWPPFSPDLNPIENLWAILKREIYKLHPELEHANKSEDTRHLLIEAAKEAWYAVDQEIRTNLSDTMPHRVDAVIKADGWYTKY